MGRGRTHAHHENRWGSRVTDATNPNGSERNVAGIAGNGMGMMPHPERCVEPIVGGDDGARSLVEPVTAGVAA